MSVYQAQSTLHTSLHTSSLPTTGLAEGSVSDSGAAQISLLARLAGLGRRVRRSLTQLDACDMTPERAAARQQDFERIMLHADTADADTRRRALEACVPLLYNIRVPSARAQYLRKVAFLAPGYAEHPEQFMRQMLPAIELYGRGLSCRKVLEAAGM